MKQIERMKLTEFSLRMIAFNLSEVDDTAKRRELAWSINQAQAIDKNNEPVYPDFKSFFDYEKAVNDVLSVDKPEQELDADLVRIAKRLQEYRGKEGNNG